MKNVTIIKIKTKKNSHIYINSVHISKSNSPNVKKNLFFENKEGFY